MTIAGRCQDACVTSVGVLSQQAQVFRIAYFAQVHILLQLVHGFRDRVLRVFGIDRDPAQVVACLLLAGLGVGLVGFRSYLPWKRAITFFITVPMSFIEGVPISAITALTPARISSWPAALGR